MKPIQWELKGYVKSTGAVVIMITMHHMNVVSAHVLLYI